MLEYLRNIQLLNCFLKMIMNLFSLYPKEPQPYDEVGSFAIERDGDVDLEKMNA